MLGDTVSRQALMRFHVPDLARRKWQFFGSLAFRRRSVPSWMAERCFDAWINEIDEEGISRWFRMNELRAFPNHPQFFVLLGGLPPCSKYSLMYEWQKIAGDADLEYFALHGDVDTFIGDAAPIGSDVEIRSDLA